MNRVAIAMVAALLVGGAARAEEPQAEMTSALSLWSSSPSSVLVGQRVELNITAVTTNLTPDTVSLYEGGNPLKDCAWVQIHRRMIGPAQGGCATSFTDPGVHKLSAKYDGYTAELSIRVVTLPSSVKVSTSPASPVYGDLVTFKAVVTGGDAGDISFFRYTSDPWQPFAYYCSSAIVNGLGSCSAVLNAGSSLINVKYSGTTTHAGQITQVAVPVAKFPTPPLIVTSSPNPSFAGELVTFDIVIPAPGATGTLKVTFGSTKISANIIGGRASAWITPADHGTYFVAAEYSGDSNRAGSKGGIYHAVLPAHGSHEVPALSPMLLLALAILLASIGGLALHKLP